MLLIHLDFLVTAQQQALLDGPALTPPPGVTPNFDDPPNKENMAYAIYITCFVLGSMFVFTRIYGTWFCTKKAYISDYLLIVTYCFFVAFMSIIFCQVHAGYFVHQWNFRLKDAIYLFHLLITATNLWAVTIMLIKVAILLEWLRIFVPRGTRNYFYWTLMFLLCVDVLFYSTAIISVNLTCIPHAKLWNPLLSGHCIDSKSVNITSAAINFASDMVVLLFPQRVIWGLKLSFDKRIDVSAVFMVGFLACIAAGFRLAMTISYSSSQDLTYTLSKVGIWIVVETTCGLIVFCTPSLPKALTELGVTKIYTTLKSWIRKTLIKKSDVQLHNRSPSEQPYGQTFKAHQWQELGWKPDGIPITFGPRSGLAKSDDVGLEMGYNPVHSETAILRTTQTGITTEEDNQGKAFNSVNSYQHPWRSEH